MTFQFLPALVLLSIITPSFNPGHWLEKCVENVAENLPPDTEHLIIDGGSTDGTVAKLADLAARYPHLRWISEKDRGQSDAMNKGIRMAAGKWIGFLNADDYYESGALRSAWNHIRRNPEKECLLAGNLRVWNEKDELISVNRPSAMHPAAMLADVCEWPYNPSAYFYPASLHDKIGFFPEDEHFAMDYDFMLKLMMAGIPVDYQDEIWGNFRLLPEAKTGKDQADNASYLRAEGLRNKYLSHAGFQLRTQVLILKFFWAVRNKVLGTCRQLFKSQ